MIDWKDIHPNFTKKLQERWESFGFDYEQVKIWINDYGFSPYDADFAIYIGDNDFIISEMTKEGLAELRGKYNEAVKNKEIDFPFEESEEEEEENIALNRRDWRNIRSDFTPELVQQWQECGFNYEEVQDWINIGMGIGDIEFCAWLRDVKRVNSEWVLNHGNAEQLRNEHQQYCLLITQQVQMHHI